MLICGNVITVFFFLPVLFGLTPFPSPPALLFIYAVCDLWHFEKVNAAPCCSEELFAGISKGLWRNYDKLVCMCERLQVSTFANL